MAKTIAYMIIWTTYGTWLQGDERDYVKDGQILPPNQSLENSNKQNLSKKPVRLSLTHQKIVQETILQMAKQLNQKIFALSVSSAHVHILAEYIPMPIGLVVRHYKGAVQSALRKIGLSGNIWTKGFDKRYCFDERSLRNRIDYVESHNKNSKNI